MSRSIEASWRIAEQLEPLISIPKKLNAPLVKRDKAICHIGIGLRTEN